MFLAHDNTDAVQNHFIFYDSIELIGNGHFKIEDSCRRRIIIDSVYDDGQRVIPGPTPRAQVILPAEYVVPGPIYEYLTNLGTVITPGGQVVKVNVPEAIIPQPPDPSMRMSRKYRQARSVYLMMKIIMLTSQTIAPTPQ